MLNHVEPCVLLPRLTSPPILIRGVTITMKAKSFSFFAQSFLFLAATLSMAPPSALALGDKVGEFAVPVEVHWGDAILMPGAYSISTRGPGSGSMMCVYKEDSPTAGYLIPAVEQETIPVTSEKTELVLGKKDGTLYVKELRLGSEGMDLHYAPPKSKK
jgi:hypothetical protein